jgi:phosphoribosylformylglycinamidine cyclo-ligase
MAEHPGVMEPGEFDLVGFAVGVAERDALITGDRVTPGDALVGISSPNLRSNGFSLARRVVFDVAGLSLTDPMFADAPATVADELLAPSVIYAPAVLDAVRQVDVRAVAHVTGGGIPGNLARVLPAGCAAVVDTSTWEQPRVFGRLQQLGDIAADEMYRVFNCGIGMILATPQADAARLSEVLSRHGHRAGVIGEVVTGDRTVSMR